MSLSICRFFSRLNNNRDSLINAMNEIRDVLGGPICRRALTQLGRITIGLGGCYFGSVLIRVGRLPIIPAFLLSAEVALILSKRHAYSTGIAVSNLGISLYHECSALALTTLNPPQPNPPQPPHIQNLPAPLQIPPLLVLNLPNNDDQLFSRSPENILFD